MGFWSFFSCSPFSWAFAALLASAPLIVLVMSTASWVLAQAQSRVRRSALLVFDVIVSFPRDPQRLRRRGRGVALPDQRPEEAPLLPLIRGLTAFEAPLQRPRGQLLFRRALRGI